MNNFEDFKEYCKYFAYGYDIDRNVVETCRKEEAIPPGHSWGVCDPIHCPAMNSERLTKDDIIHADELLSREPAMTVKVATSTISRYTELCLIYGCERVEEIFNTKINDAIRTAIAETFKELKEAVQ